jgi:trans-2,3-dihydro-3-hydroxyanthranilate isomerase
MSVTPRIELPVDVRLDRPRAGHRYFVLDVFSDRPLEGNQLGIFADAQSFSAQLMQSLAREMNFAETVFLLPADADGDDQGEGDVRMRIFTPSQELPFAGHPVLGTACLIGLAVGRERVRLRTGLGVIPVDVRDDGGGLAFGRMAQPIPTWAPYEQAAELLGALGVERSGLPIEAYRNGPLHVYVELASEQAVAELRPDMRVLADLDCCASCFAATGTHVKTRMFAPSYGVNEDPATGSAAGPLAVHLSRHGRIAFGEEIEIRQGVEIGRPSLLLARAHGSPREVKRVEVGGSAVIVARGEFALP